MASDHLSAQATCWRHYKHKTLGKGRKTQKKVDWPTPGIESEISQMRVPELSRLVDFDCFKYSICLHYPGSREDNICLEM